jgi:hypothetical protein
MSCANRRRSLFPKLLFLVISLSACGFAPAEGPGYAANRIAMSFDGNSEPDPEYKWPTGDPDDWGALAASCAIIAKLELQDKLVHCSYNNFIDAPAGPDSKNQLKISADGSIARWDFDERVFFDVTRRLDAAVAQLSAEMAKSTPADPLFFIHAGLSEFVFLVVDDVIKKGGIEALKNVHLISHSGFNEKEKRRPHHRTWSDIQKLAGNRIQYDKIKDQNEKTRPKILWHSGSDFSVWSWMRDHVDPNLRWLYTRLEAHSGKVADISDCGMVFYLLTGEDDGSPAKFKAFLGDGIKSPETDAKSSAKLPEKGEIVTIEAESMKLTTGWNLETSKAASGGSYVTYEGPNSFHKVTDHIISTTFKITKPGNYTVKWTMRQPNGVPGDQANDAWICFPDARQLAREKEITGFHKFVGRSTTEFGLNGQLDLEGDQPWMTLSFPKAGTYKVEIAGRSTGFQLDQVILYTGINFDEAKKNLQKKE